MWQYQYQQVVVDFSLNQFLAPKIQKLYKLLDGFLRIFPLPQQ
jgi:hypothetical protein